MPNGICSIFTISLKTIVEQLILLGGVYLNPVLSQLGKVKDSATVSALSQMRYYDQLCTVLAVNKVDLRAMIDAMLLPARADAWWEFFLSGVPENQLARPEEYNFNRNLIHSPAWIALLLTKFNVPPPVLGVILG
jgi:hypothetical protein